MTETPQQDRVNTENLRDYRQLRRSRTDRKISGVAGGLARHLNIDPTVVRVAFVVLCLFGGAGFVLYAALWLLVPEDGEEAGEIATAPGTRNALLIVAAVVAGLLVLGHSWGGFGFPWPFLFLAAGAVVFIALRDKNRPAPTQPAADWQPVTPDWASTTMAYAPAPPTSDRGPKLFWPTVALVAVALGGLGLYDVIEGGVVDAAYPALALAVIGAMLVMGAWIGRPGGLIFLGVVAALALALSQISSSLSAGDISRTPTAAAHLENSYEVGAGQIMIDLTQVTDLEALDGRALEVSAGAGQITVIVPEGLDANVRGEVTYGGEIQLGLDSRNGTGVVLNRLLDGGTDVPVVDIDINLKFGEIVVRQS